MMERCGPVPCVVDDWILLHMARDYRDAQCFYLSLCQSDSLISHESKIRSSLSHVVCARLLNDIH